MRQFPHAPRCYAEALLDTIDFLCESRQPLPPVACGLGQAHFIRHRLTKIMRGASPKAMSQRVRLAMFLSAALLLPMQPFVFGSANKAPMTLTADPPELPLIVSSSIESLPSHVLDETRSDSQSSGDLTTSNPPNVSSSATTATTESSRSQSRALRGKKVWSTAVSQDGRCVVRATTGRRVLLSDLSLNTESDRHHGGLVHAEWKAVCGGRERWSSDVVGRDCRRVEPRLTDTRQRVEIGVGLTARRCRSRGWA